MDAMDKRYDRNITLSPQPMPEQDDADMVLYPEIYRKFLPHVDSLIADMEKMYGNIDLTEDLLNRMTDTVIQRAGIHFQTESVSDSIPTISYGGNYWRNHNRSSLNDILRILFLQQLFGGHRRPRWRRRFYR